MMLSPQLTHVLDLSRWISTLGAREHVHIYVTDTCSPGIFDVVLRIRVSLSYKKKQQKIRRYRVRRPCVNKCKLTSTLVGANNGEVETLTLQALEIALAEGGGQVDPEGAAGFGRIVTTFRGIRFLVELLRR